MTPAGAPPTPAGSGPQRAATSEAEPLELFEASSAGSPVALAPAPAFPSERNVAIWRALGVSRNLSASASGRRRS